MSCPPKLATAARLIALMAFRWHGEQYSYRDIDAASTELAQHLVALGAGPNVIIGLLMERCPQMYVAMLGIMKAGAAHVPLDPAYPPERIAFMLEDTAAPILVTHRSFEDRLTTDEGCLADKEALRVCTLHWTCFV